MSKQKAQEEISKAVKNAASKPEPAPAAPEPKKLPKLDVKAALEKAGDDQSLSGFDLSGCDFSGCDLRAVDFRFSDLTGCNFRDAVLQGCSFTGATFEPDQFNDADTRWSVWQ